MMMKVCALLATASAYYLPGIAVHDYEAGDRAWLKVNSLTSSKTQVPYAPYDVRSRVVFDGPLCERSPLFGSFLSRRDLSDPDSDGDSGRPPSRREASGASLEGPRVATDERGNECHRFVHG